MDHSTDQFAHKAADWDKGGMRSKNAGQIAQGILGQIHFTGGEHLMDFGAGTGLLSEPIAPHVRKITAVDTSPAMLEAFAQKSWACETEVFNIDLVRATLEYRFDGIISSMALHHIADVAAMFEKFYSLVQPEGFIALADLEEEDGSFHNNNAGVMHFGFKQDAFRQFAVDAGFRAIEITIPHVISKQVDGKLKDFPILLLTARR